MVSALNSGASGPGSSPGWRHCVVFLVRHFTLAVPLSTQVYKWVPVNLMLGGNPALGQHPIQGEVEILLVASCYRNRDKLQPDGPLGSNADFTISYVNISPKHIPLHEVFKSLHFRAYTIFCKNRSAMRTWGLMLSFIPFGWNAVLKYQYLGVYLQQVRRQTRGKYMAEYGLLYLHLCKGLLLKAFEQEGYISAIAHYGHYNQRANF